MSQICNISPSLGLEVEGEDGMERRKKESIKETPLRWSEVTSFPLYCVDG